MSTEQERRLAAISRAHLSWANTPNRTLRTAPAREALWQKFLAQADGDPVRAESYRKAHYADLARRSAKARRKAKESAAAAEAAEAELRDAGGSDAA